MIELWHGGNRWIGPPEVRPPRRGKYECGPGLYLTTSYLRARTYARGGKVTTKVRLADDVHWLERAQLPLRELLDYAKTAPRLSGRAQLLDDLVRRYAEPETAMDQLCDVSRLVNLLINSEALAGKPGVHLAQWLGSKGIDASLHRPMGQDQWVIVFNPDVIKAHRVIPAESVSLSDYDLPRIELPPRAASGQQ